MMQHSSVIKVGLGSISAGMHRRAWRWQEEHQAKAQCISKVLPHMWTYIAAVV